MSCTSCTLEKEDVLVLGGDELRFGSLHEVINVEQIGCIRKARESVIMTRRNLIKMMDHALNEAMHGEGLPRIR